MSETTSSVIIMITIIATGTVGTLTLISAEFDMPLVDTETIPLRGVLASGDFILLMDITGFVSESGHVAMKVPCEPDDQQLLTIVALLPPAEGPFESPDAIRVDMNIVPLLSGGPNSCVYHGEIPDGITNVILRNTSDDAISFIGNAGYTVTISIVGETEDK